MGWWLLGMLRARALCAVTASDCECSSVVPPRGTSTARWTPARIERVFRRYAAIGLCAHTAQTLPDRAPILQLAERALVARPASPARTGPILWGAMPLTRGRLARASQQVRPPASLRCALELHAYSVCPAGAASFCMFVQSPRNPQPETTHR